MDERCELCGERFGANDERAEMYDPTRPEDEAVTCHAQCGLSRDMEVA